MIQLFHAVRDGPRARAPNHNPQAETLLLIRPNGPMRTKFEEEQNTMTLRKIGALVLALVMVLSVSVTAVAVNEPITNDGKTGTKLNSLTNDADKVNLVKELKIYNADGSAIYLPDVTFGYEIEAVTQTDPQKTITDSDGVVAQVFSGVGAPSITATVAFGPTVDTGYVDDGGTAVADITQPIAADVAGTSLYRPIEVDFSAIDFPHAGVYRYKIKETPATAELTAAGVVELNATDYKDERYLDVYVRMVDPTNTGTYTDSEIYGYVCYPETIGNDSLTTSNDAAKTAGYVGENGAHKYETVNLKVQKTISGALAAKGHQFPFQVAVTHGSGSTVNGTKLAVTSTGNTTVTGNGITEVSGVKSVTLNGSGDATIKVALADTQYVILSGIPSLLAGKVDVVETNDTYDTYTASATYDAATVNVNSDSTAILYKDADGTVAQQTMVTTLTATKNVMVVTNLLTEISPTGYVTRFAPYALMLIGGVTLFIILAVKRRKNEEEEA